MDAVPTRATDVADLGKLVAEFRPGKTTLIRYLLSAISLIVIGATGTLWLVATFAIENFNPRGRFHAHDEPGMFIVIGIACAAAIGGGSFLIYKMLRVRQFLTQQYQRGFVFTLFHSVEVVGYWDIAQVDEWKTEAGGMAGIAIMSPLVLIVAMLAGESGGDWYRLRLTCRDGRIIEVNTALAIKAGGMAVILKNFSQEFGYRYLRRAD